MNAKMNQLFSSRYTTMSCNQCNQIELPSNGEISCKLISIDVLKSVDVIHTNKPLLTYTDLHKCLRSGEPENKANVLLLTKEPLYIRKK